MRSGLLDRRGGSGQAISGPDDYRHLYDLEAELSDGKPNRYELPSIWRPARDEGYAQWAKSIGPDTCQILFFGMRGTNDWFHRRAGAFNDALRATERLLGSGMKPRRQLFLTTKLLPELKEFLSLIDKHRLRNRVQELGGEFQIFMYPPSPGFEGRLIERLRPTAEELAELPGEISEPSRKHFGRDILWQTEETLYADLLNHDENHQNENHLLEVLWFFVCSNWDVFSNVGTLEDWWCLGNLKRDPIDLIAHYLIIPDSPGIGIEPADDAVERCP